jgi:AAA domain
MENENEVQFSRKRNKFQFRTVEDDTVRERKGPIPLSEVKEEKITYLWHPYIPMDRVTMLGGDPGAGKSFITGALAATLSRGEQLPGEEEILREPMNVLMLSAEDDPADTIRPRLRNLRADMTRIFVETADIVLDTEGMQAIEQMVEQTEAKLLIIDPIVAYFGSKADMNRANDVRPIMKGLASLAKRKHIAILVIRHNRKSSPGQPEGKRIHSGFGSVDFTAAVRSELAVEVGKGDRSYFYHIKMNAGPKGPGWKYWIENLEDDTGLFHWDGTIQLTMKKNESGISKKFKNEDAIKNWLHDWLKDKPEGDLAKNILAAGMLMGYSQTKLEHVKKGIAYSERVGSEWWWKLNKQGANADTK